jgi:hypothetical protein
MRSTYNEYATSLSQRNGDPTSAPLIFGKRLNYWLRLLELSALLALFWSSTHVDADQEPYPVFFILVFIGAAAALIFSPQSRWICADGNVHIESTSLVRQKTSTVAGSDVASLRIETVDSPAYDLELRTHAGELHVLRHFRRSDADAMLTQLSAALRR